MALSPLSSHTVHRGNSLRVLGGSRGTVSSMDGHALPGRLPELSNFYCLPGRAGGSPLAISHFHGDHVGGLRALSKMIPIDKFYDHGDVVDEVDRGRLND